MMKKIVYILTSALTLTSLFTACNKEKSTDNLDSVNPDAPAAQKVTIAATIADAATRVTFDPSFDASSKPTGMSHTWEEGDKLKVMDASNHDNFKVYDLVDGAGSPNGKFEGETVEASSYDVEAVPCNETETGNRQTQAKDGDADHLKFVAAATGVTDLTDVQLTETSGIIGIIAKLPAGVAKTVNMLTIETSTDDFATKNSLAVALTYQEDVGGDDILKVYANVPAGWTLAAGTKMFLKFGSTNDDHKVYTRYQEFDAAATPAEGKFNYLKLNCSTIDKHAGASTCDGTSTDPYLIADKYQMKAMRELMPENKTTYFSLVSDIDLENEPWTPLNYEEGFARGLDLDGNSHTISNLKSTDKQDYPSFVGVVNGSVKNLVFDGATITGGNNVAGVLAGYVGSVSESIIGNISGITVKNAQVTGSKRGLGGVAGMVSKVSETIEDCHAVNTTVSSTNDRVGGLFGQVEKSFLVKNCTAENVTVSGTINIGGLVGVGYGNFTDCTSSGSISSTNTTSNTDIALGGLVGYFENGVISHCSSSVTIDQTTNGRDIGGLVGKMLAGTVEKCFASGNVKGLQRNVGGLIGLITNAGGDKVSTVADSYCIGSVAGNAYSGGFLGLFEKGKAVISNCYATGNVVGTGFGVGGLVGFVGGADYTMSKSAAWNSSVVPANYGSVNWSSGSVAAVAFPTCTLTDNYRNPAMSLTAWWVPDADYSHPDVSSSTPLVVKDIATGELRPTTATGTGSGNDNYPQFAYHGKVEAGKTLSQLASTTLGWSSDVWDFTGELPTLK